MKNGIIISPTGLGLRSDPAGSGEFGARRGPRTHNGFDWRCVVAPEPQRIRAPHAGVLARMSYPYADDLVYQGVLLVGKRVWSKLWYFRPTPTLIGSLVSQGEDIGVAQDVTKKYPGTKMQPHIHHRIVRCDPTLLTARGNYVV